MSSKPYTSTVTVGPLGLFSCFAVSREGERKLEEFQYTPMNDFRLEIEDSTYCILDAISTAELYGVVHTSIANVIVLRWRIPSKNTWASSDSAFVISRTIPRRGGMTFLRETQSCSESSGISNLGNVVVDR